MTEEQKNENTTQDADTETPASTEEPHRPERHKARRCKICGQDFEGDPPTVVAESALPCPPEGCRSYTLEAKTGVQPFVLTNHYSMCIFPFTFHEEDGNSFFRLRNSLRWKERNFSMDDPDDLDRTEYFLPYVRRFLFPSLFSTGTSYDPHQDFSAVTMQHYRLDLGTLGALEEGRLPFHISGHDDREDRDFSHEMWLDQIQLIVTNMRVGFLIFRMERGGTQPTYLDQMRATLYFRLLAPLYKGFAMPQMTVGEETFQVTQLLAHLLSDFSEVQARQPGAYSQRLDLPVRASYDDRMMVYTFSCIDHRTCLSDLERARRVLERHAFSNFDDGLSTQAPHGHDETRQWLSQRFQSASKEGCSLVVFDTDTYHREFLGEYHASYYFDVFFLATLQRTSLLLLFERLSDISSLTSFDLDSQKALRRLRKDVLLFKNQSWFSQITHRERGLILWRRWQRVFEVHTLMDEVNEQSKELSAYLQDRARQQVEWGVRIGGFLATSLPAIFSLKVLLGKAPWVDTLRWVLALVVLAGAGLFAWFVLFQEEQ